MDSQLTLAEALTDAAKAIHSPQTLEDTLDSIVRAARDAVPGFDQVGISVVHRNGKVETMSGTSQLVWELDDLQYRLNEGPCVDSIEGEPPMVVVEDLPHDQRWPRYSPEAARCGVRAQMGLQLYSDEETLGGLNLYSTETTGVPEDSRQIAELFATHAAIALGRTRHEDQLNQAIATRKTIGQAIGIVMERYHIDEDRAFQFLTRASSTSNIKLRDVAQEVVRTTDERFRDH